MANHSSVLAWKIPGTGEPGAQHPPATLYPGEGQAILTVSVCKTRSQPYTQTDNKCTDELPAGLWSKGEAGGLTHPGASNGHGHICVCLQSRRR